MRKRGGAEIVTSKAAAYRREPQGFAKGVKAPREIEKKQEKVKVRITEMKRPHMAEILEIDELSFGYPWSEADFIRALRGRSGMVAEYNGKVVGYMVYKLYKRRILVLNFAVHPDWRHKGIGTQMVNYLKGSLSVQQRTRLVVYVQEKNVPAQLFFREMGFRWEKTSDKFYTTPRVLAYKMVYNYGQEPERPLRTIEEGI